MVSRWPNAAVTIAKACVSSRTVALSLSCTSLAWSWDQPWPNEEHLWPTRLEATRPAGTGPDWWKTAARDLVTYPETVALARLLASRPLQRRTVTETRGHLPHRLGELPQLLAELADQLGRP